MNYYDDWHNSGMDYPTFQFDNMEQQSSGFDAMGSMDKFLTLMDRVIVPLGNIIPKFSDSAARHREINASRQRNQDLFSVVQQQQEQIQQLIQQLNTLQYQQMPPPMHSPMHLQHMHTQSQLPMYLPPPTCQQHHNPPASYNQYPVMAQLPWNEYVALMYGTNSEG